MMLDDFKATIKAGDPMDIATQHISKLAVHALPGEEAYSAFKEQVSQLVPQAEAVYIVGSGNWGFSLNPNKIWEPFRPESDIDVAVVSEHQFLLIWEELRQIHRKNWYKLDDETRTRLRRNGENVYCGFVSPAWIPFKSNASAFAFRRVLNKLQGERVGYRRVTMMYYRNMVELVDYCKRGFIIARGRLRT